MAISKVIARQVRAELAALEHSTRSTRAQRCPPALCRADASCRVLGLSLRPADCHPGGSGRYLAIRLTSTADVLPSCSTREETRRSKSMS